MITIDSVLAAIAQHMNLSKQTERELLDEIRDHLEDAVDDARQQGKDETIALLKAAEHFGVDEVGKALNETHSSWESSEALLMLIVPVFCTVVLRWLVFGYRGTAADWPMLVSRPVLIIIAAVTLLWPLSQLRRWQYAMIGWGIFWGISIIFMAFPTMRVW